MDYRHKLFSYKALYDLKSSENLFVEAMKESIDFHRSHCPDYNKILNHFAYNREHIKKAEDLHKIPPVPTLFYKAHQMYSLPENKMVLQSTTSGTKGVPTKVGLDLKTCYYGARMLINTLARHGLLSPVPANYIVMGYQPSRHNTMGAVKTAFGATFLAPPLHRAYALKDNGTGYDLNIEGIQRALLRYSRSRFPVRFIGFPAYLLFMMKRMKENNLKLTLHPQSKILLGGGWKQFSNEAVDKPVLYQMAEETLGIHEHNIKEFFAVVESNILYCACDKHHFHVPIYGRVIIRDPQTMAPVPNGTPGLLNLLSPLVGSMPLGSIITDDIGVLHEGEQCGCGIPSPYFEVLGRAGMTEIKTCAATAHELL